MTEPKPHTAPRRRERPSRSIQLRLAGSVIALAAGGTALVVAILLVRTALS